MVVLATSQARAKPDAEAQDKEIVAWSTTPTDDYALQYNGVMTFLDQLTPKDRRQKIDRAKQYRNVDIIDRILHIRMEFGRKPKRIKCKNARQKQFYEENVLPLLKDYYTKWVYEFHSIGDVFNHFGFKPDDERTPMFILSENPLAVDVINVFGNEYYKLKMASNLKQIFRLLKEKRIDIASILNTGMVDKDIAPDLKQEIIDILNQLPKHLLRALSSNTNDILIINQENMYRTSHAKPDYCTYSEPPLMKVAEPIELRRLLTASDFATATKKNEIIHTRVGNEKDGSKSKDPKVIEDVHKKITNQTQGDTYLTTGYDVKIERIGPDPKSWGKEKFEESNTRILNWAGVTLTLISGESSAYGSSVVSLKGLEASIDSDCEVFDQFVKHFFNEINKRNHFRDEVKVEYEPNRLIDFKNRMELVRYLVDMGGMAWEDFCNEFNVDPKEQLAKKKKDNEEVLGVAKPWFEIKQGGLSADLGVQPSKPTNGDGKPGRKGNPVRDTNQPRPSQ
ncbi:MAG: hypothetical protein Q8910_00355 [Bacteroidota bacterium]|nr:hypothetical protein [Bacteroidota bacterium]